MREGEVVEIQGEWVPHKGPPPTDPNCWHLQYATSDDQMYCMQNFDVRGAARRPKAAHQPAKDWDNQRPLTHAMIYDIGTTSVCRLTHSDLTRHDRREALVMNYPRLLCFAAQFCHSFDIHTIEAWWRCAKPISRHKRRMTEGKSKGWGKGKPKGKSWGRGKPKGK